MNQTNKRIAYDYVIETSKQDDKFKLNTNLNWNEQQFLLNTNDDEKQTKEISNSYDK